MYSRRVLKKMNGSAENWGSDLNNIIETSNSLRMSARDLIWSLNPSEDSVFDFILRINIFAEEFFDCSNIKYHRCENYDKWKSLSLNMDAKRQMLFIIKEAMNNSFKYSGSKNIYFKVTVGDALSLKIIDDGIGFVHPSEYTGYGITNMFKRANRAGFKLEIFSSPGKGTTIFIDKVKYSLQNDTIEK
jgi:signal transduction histidine kinase